MQRLPVPVFRVAAVLLLLLGLSRSRPVRADEAVLPDGRRLSGQLTQDRDDRLRFVPAGAVSPLLLEQLQQVQLPAAERAPLAAHTAYRMILHGDQWLTGELLGLDARALSWRTLWGAPVTVPRDAVAAVTHTPGLVTFFQEDFETDLKAWKVTGTPALSNRWHVSGQRSLVLNAPGQAVECPLTQALEAGQTQIHFHEVSVRRGAGCRIEMEFQSTSGRRSLHVKPADNADAFTVEGIDGPGIRQLVRRSSGWHRLVLEFSPGSLLLTLDDAVLWYSRQQGPGGSLCRVRLATAGEAAGREPFAEVAFDDFSLARRVEELPHRREDVRQDELWLLDGDQLLGQVRAADRRALQLHGRFGERSFGWGEVRGVYLHQEPSPARTTQGEHVRVGLRNGRGTDELEGAVHRLDANRLVLQHAVLGELTIDRSYLQALRWLFYGSRIELENGFQHLGQKVAPSLANPRPDGLSLRRTFRLEAVPEQAYVVLEVTELKGSRDGLSRGDGTTQLLVNDQPVDYLNRYVEKASRMPQRIRLAVPRQMLRVGENVVELRQTPNRDTESYEDCGVARLALELPR